MLHSNACWGGLQRTLMVMSTEPSGLSVPLVGSTTADGAAAWAAPVLSDASSSPASSAVMGLMSASQSWRATSAAPWSSCAAVSAVGRSVHDHCRGLRASGRNEVANLPDPHADRCAWRRGYQPLLQQVEVEPVAVPGDGFAVDHGAQRDALGRGGDVGEPVGQVDPLPRKADRPSV